MRGACVTELSPTSTTASSQLLYEELTGLRQREGITLRKLRDSCPGLQGLPATTDQLLRSQLADADRHVAAFEVVKCAITRGINRTDFAHILGGTLALPASDGRHRHGRYVPQDLTGRRRELAIELHVTEKALRRLEEDAYVELAGQLVAAEQSPCRADPEIDGRIATASSDTLVISLEIGGDAELLLRLLSELSVERRKLSREALAHAVFNHVPRAAAYVTGDEDPDVGPNSWRLLRNLLDAVLMELWHQDNVPDTEVLLTAESLHYYLLSNNDPLQLPSEVLAREWPRFEGLLGEVKYERRFTYSNLLPLKQKSLSSLADLLLKVEAADSWSTVLRGDCGRQLQPV